MDQPKLIPIYSISSPAKAILCGQHAVVYGKDAIAIGIGLHCRGTLSKQPRVGETAQLSIASSMEPVQIIDSQMMKFLQGKLAQLQKEQRYTYERYEADLSTSEGGGKGTSHYERSTHFKLALLLQMCQVAWEGWQQQSQYDFVLRVDSDIPISRCLGSSAAYNTVLATALLIIFQKRPFSLTNELKEEINDISMKFQAVQHGTPSGIDNYISVHGGVILYNKTKEPRFTKLSHAAAHIKQLMNVGVIDSCVDKNTKVAVGNVRAKYNAEQKYRGMVDQIGNIVCRVAELIEDQKCSSKSIDQVLRLCSKNHELLRELGVSHPKIEEIVSEWEKKDWSAKVTGSGMGGCVLLLSHKSTPLSQGVVLASIDQNGLKVAAICE